jgi:hypothetical protein
MKKYILISLLSTLVTSIVVLSVFSPNYLPGLVVSVYKFINPFDSDESQNNDESGQEVFRDLERENLNQLASNLESTPLNDLILSVPKNWNFDKAKDLKSGTSLEFSSPLGNKVTLTYFSLKDIDPNNFNFTKYNINKDLINNLFEIDTYYSYPSLVNKDSIMMLYTIMERNPNSLIKLWFKELPNTEEASIYLAKYSPINTVIYVYDNNMYILNTNFSSDLDNVDNFKELSELTLLIESLDLRNE